jgi:predicted nucleotidyltransferase
MIEAIISSKTRVKLLTLFLLNSDKRFYVRELVRKTGENINSVRRELGRLEGIGLLTSYAEGNMRYYSVNKKMPIYEELKSIFLKTEGIGKVIKSNLSEIGKIKSAFIYGSFAKGEEHLSSDIDLMIIGDVDEKKLLLMIKKAEEKLSREINYTIFSKEEFMSRLKKKDPFISNVMDEEKIMLLGDIDEL